jgi:drug/metabolite transporter (DMT)-like permease
MDSNPLPEIDRRKQQKAEALLLGVTVVWAINFPVAKYALGGMHPLVFNATRYILAAAVLWIVVGLRPTFRAMTGVDWKKLVTVGLVATVLYQSIFILGLNLTTAANSSILLATSPLWTVALDVRIHRQHVTVQTWGGMVVSFVGIALVILGSSERLTFGSTELAGDLLTLLAAALWALNTILQKPLLVSYSAQQLASVMVSVGAVGLTIIAIPFLDVGALVRLDWTFALAIFFSGALSIGASFVIWSYAVKRIGAGRTANFSNLVPVFAVTLSYLLLGEQLTLVQFVGAGITLVGVWITRSA